MRGRSSRTCPARRRGGQGRQLLAEQGADSLAQTADDVMLLGGDDLTALPGSLEDDVLIQRLDGVDVDDAGVDASAARVSAALRASLTISRWPRCNITALGELLALADLEMIVGLIVEHGNSQTAKAEVDRTLHLVGGADSSACFHVVGGQMMVMPGRLRMRRSPRSTGGKRRPHRRRCRRG